jgi:molybdopterin-containing oxidoreductase family membrane subunit
VSFDFSVGVIPGWHATIFPPYFVAGAIFSGFAMVLTLLIPCRKWFGLEQMITIKHLENMAKIILLTGTMVGYAYALEFFIAWYSGNPYEWHVFRFNRLALTSEGFDGSLWWAYWAMVSCNVLVPQIFWFKRMRTSIPVMFVASILINIGMWFERFVIIATSLHRDFLPSSWGYFSPTAIDIVLYLGTFGLFFTCFLLFIRWIPMIAIAEVKMALPEADPHHESGSHDPHHALATAPAAAE